MGIKASPPSLKDAFRLTEENNSLGNPAAASIRNQKAADAKRANMAEEDAEVAAERAKQKAKGYADGGRIAKKRTPQERAEDMEFNQNGPRDAGDAGAYVMRRAMEKIPDRDVGTGIGAALGATAALPLSAAGAAYRAATGRKSRSDEDMSELSREVKRDSKAYAKGGRVTGYKGYGKAKKV